MARELLGIGASFAAVFLMLGIAGALKKRGVSPETCRKLVHILLSNWIILALFMFESVWFAIVVPGCFVVLNSYSYRKGLFAGIEREQDNTPGTVWYAVSLLVLCLAGWSLGQPWIAACGILAMGYGDGLAALIGMRWGKRKMPAPYHEKTMEGCVAVLFFAGLSVGIVCAVFAPEIALAAAFCSGVIAMAAELYSPRGEDNLTLPICVAITVLLMSRFPASIGFFICLSVTLLILLAAFMVGAVNFSGLHVGTLMGVLIYLYGGWLSYGALGAFFVAGSLISRVGKAKKAAPASLHERKGPRGAVQVIANTLPAFVMAQAYHVSGNEAFLLAVIVSFGAAAADTFSSEIGMLSKAQPVSALTLRKVERGLSGGITLMGLCGGALGALILAALAFPFFGAAGFLTVLIFSVFGSLLDSVLGAAIQAKYTLPGGGMTERKTLDGAPLILARGVPWINNDIVNFLSPLLAAALSVVIVG